MSLEPVTHTLRLGFVHTYTSDLLDPWLELAASLLGFHIDVYHAPYGLALSDAQADSALVQHKPDVTLLMLRREDLDPQLSRPVVELSPDRQDELTAAVLKRVRQIVGMFRNHTAGHLALTMLPSHRPVALGMFDAQTARSEAAWWSTVKSQIGACLRESFPSSLLLDLDDISAFVGRSNFFDRRYLYSAQYPFTPVAAWEFARRIVGVGALIKLPKAKVIVLDADNTLWGGIVGEDGPHGIALGPEYPGNTFVDFQRRLLDFQQRGLLLALCSKNNPQDVAQVLEEHPHQLLRDEHFAARRVNWLPKIENIQSLAQELNLGLESFVFVDDSAHECAAVRLALPMVEVIQTPSRPIEIPSCLDHISRLEVLALTDEDIVKTQMYSQDRRRREFSEAVSTAGDAGAYLAMLGMQMRISLDCKTHLTRLSQLTLKTNQFNLTTRRYGEQAILQRIEDPQWLVADFSLSDTFGDAGIVGLAMFHFESTLTARLDNFLMSCRVIGRSAESAFLDALAAHLKSLGIAEIFAEYVPSPKNELIRDFLPKQGFSMRDDKQYVRSLRDSPPKPVHVHPISIEWTDNKELFPQNDGLKT
jgi:FkbH-like protein